MTTVSNDDARSALLDDISSKAPEGTTIPPKSVRDIIEKTAGYVHRNGAAFEERIRNNSNVRTSFVQPGDPYNAYYAWRLEEIRAGKGNAISSGQETGVTGVSTQGREERKGPEAPQEFQFSARMPNISAQDLDVVKLTALYVAKNGRSWMTTLSQREASNFQFDFLRPTHSLYPFFSRLVDQYTDLLTGATVDGGRPQKKRIMELEGNVKTRFQILDRAKKRAEWVKHQEAQKVAQEEEELAEKKSYAEIDWHDFVVVETVVFDERDEDVDLPPPTSLNDLQSASLEQKAQMSINPNLRIEEAMPGFDDGPVPLAQQLPNRPAPAVQPPFAPYPAYPIPLVAQNGQPGFPPPFQPPFQHPYQNDETSRAADLQAAQERARSAQQAASANAPVKIRNDYVPRAKARQQAQDAHLCPNCRQLIPSSEMAEHLRIEMLDPQWREQARIAQQRSLTTNLATADVANNLKRLASQRTDVFDPITGIQLTEEEAARRKRVELESFNGATTAVPGQERPDVQAQIQQLQAKYKT